MKKVLTTLLLFLSLYSAGLAQETILSIPFRQRPKVGVVLSGGGAKGIAHIGVLKTLEELDIPVDYIVGTSIGSIMAGFYALGYSADELDSIVRAQNWDLLMKDPISRRDVAYTYKKDHERFIITIPFMNRRVLTAETEGGRTNQGDLLRNLPSAMVEGQNLNNLFTKLSVGYQDDVDFNTLPIPFACVAVDLNTKEEVVFHRGNIVEAIRASMSIPGYFAPVHHGSQYLIDGGMLNNLPVDVVKKMGADYVITVDLHRFKKAKLDTDQTIPEMVATMLSIMNGEKYHAGRAESDILIEPNTSAYGVLDFDPVSVNALIDTGRVAVSRVIPRLRSLAAYLKTFPDTAPQRPRHAINLDRDSVCISQMEIQGTDADDMAWLLAKTDLGPGKWISGKDMDNALSTFYNTKAFTKVSYAIAGKEGDYRLKIKFAPERIHQAGFGFRFDSEEMASLMLGLSLNKRKLFGSKLDWETKLSTNPHTKLIYGYTFHNLTRLNVSAELWHKNMDVYDYLPFDDEDPNSEYSYRLKSTDRFSAFTARADYQVTGWRNADIDIGIQYDNYRIQSIYAIGGDHNYNIGEPITSQSWRGYFSWNFDSLDDSYFPTRGFKYDLMGSACHDTDFHGFFYGARYSLKAALPLGSRVTLIPQTFNRWLFKEGLRYYKNYVGGYLYGRYIPWQMPFVGINNAYKTRDRVDIVRADLRINLFGAHYLTLMSNYMVDWEYVTHYDGQGGKTRLPEVSRNFGAGLSYAINTIVGPIQLCAHWSTLSKSAGFYFSLGCNF